MHKSRWLGAMVAATLSVFVGTSSALADTAPQVVSVTIQGDAFVGATLQAVVVATGDPPPEITYQWTRCDSSRRCPNIAGATADTYTITAADLGFSLVVKVDVKNAAGTDEDKSTRTATVTEAPPPSDSTPPPPDPTPNPTPAPDPTPDPTPPPPGPSSSPTGSTATGNPAPAPTTTVAAPTTTVAAPTTTVAAPTTAPVEFVAAPLQAPTIAPPRTTRLRYIRPFPVVRVAGSSVRGGAYIEMLRVTAPRGSKVDVRCRGAACPVGRGVFRPGRIHRFERFLPSGLLITIRVTRTGYVGKYVRILILSHAAPARRDACLLPGHSRPTACLG